MEGDANNGQNVQIRKMINLVKKKMFFVCEWCKTVTVTMTALSFFFKSKIFMCICGHNVSVNWCLWYRPCLCSVFAQDFPGLHMVSGVINGLWGQHSAAVCGLTAAGLWLSGSVIINSIFNVKYKCYVVFSNLFWLPQSHTVYETILYSILYRW